MKANEIREMTYTELGDELKELKSQLFKLRFQAVTSQVENPMQLKLIKKDIARVKTVMREMELSGNAE